MFEKLIIRLVLVLMMQMFLSAVVSGKKNRRYGCVEGYCAMEDCQSTVQGMSNFCWIAKDSSGKALQCAGEEECKTYAEADWGNCQWSSCAVSRAANPFDEYQKTCEHMIGQKLKTMKKECESKSFDHWARIYNTPSKIYENFKPCIGNGHIIEKETKNVISHCHCYKFCGATQTESGDCEVQELDRSLDPDADIKSYRAVCKIDCKPTDELHALKTLDNKYSETANMAVTITRGMSATKTSSAGGSTSVTVSAEVAFDILKAFSATIGVSGTTGYDWNEATTTNSFEQVTHEISVPVKAGDEVTVYQVIGKCKNEDGTTYTVKSPKYMTKGKDGKIQSNNDLP